MDEEPWPFWDGVDQAQRVERWREQVGWRDDWGVATPAGLVNGSSGRRLQEQVLQPLRLDPRRVWLTDALPFFHVHRGKGSQGAAMSERYDAFAHTNARLNVHRLPDRPRPAQLVERAVREETPRLREELQRSQAPLLITLGNEALAFAAALLSAPLPERLTADGSYGQLHPARLDGLKLEVLPLLHPGQQTHGWRAEHLRWIQEQQG